MLETMVLNVSVGSTEVLVGTGIGVLLGKSEVRKRMVIESGAKGIKTVNLASKVGERLVGSALPAVDAGTRVASGIDGLFLL